ncbi:unnamed protein product [Moneuplotes crassus]|uniref:Uncharacterized protein n=1 Tax=Euplotes crassus TaxID=5936 RepID=A0AAD1X5T0_EUPCR|nr:unnamed protein product [Moneuplotes crassus]
MEDFIQIFDLSQRDNKLQSVYEDNILQDPLFESLEELLQENYYEGKSLPVCSRSSSDPKECFESNLDQGSGGLLLSSPSSSLFEDIILESSHQNECIDKSQNVSSSHISIHSSLFLKSTRATRKDVYRRKMIRAIKKFFLMLFKHHNNKLVNKRLANVSSTQILQALEDLSVVYITTQNSYEMAKFMFKFLSLNCHDQLENDCEATRAGTSTHECSQNYNDVKFESLITLEYFRTLVTSFVNLRAQSVKTLEAMESAQTWKNQSKSKGNNFTALINTHLKANIGERVEAWLKATHERIIEYL